MTGPTPRRQAVLWAAGEASARGIRLRIVSSYEEPTVDATWGLIPAGTYTSIEERAERQLLRIKGIVDEVVPDLEIVTDALPGPASTALVDDATADDLIVVGASSHTGAASFWLGSTPRRVARTSPCPVVIVRSAATLGRPDRIVVGIDGSALSDAAVRWAADEADLHHVELVVVHSWLYPYLPVGSANVPARDLTQIDAARVLDRAVDAARDRCGSAVSAFLLEETPVTALLEVVRDGDLLVVGSRGRGGVAAAMFGSTVNGVLEQSVVPVVVVRPAAD